MSDSPILNSLKPFVKDGIRSLGITKLSEMQIQVLTHFLEGKDIMIQSPARSGKTTAYEIGLVQQIDPQLDVVQALVLTPSRELTMQIVNDLTILGKRMDIQIHACLNDCNITGKDELRNRERPNIIDDQIVVGDVQYIFECITQGKLKTNHINTLIVDEIDFLFENNQIYQLFQQLPATVQTGAFGTTITKARRKWFRSSPQPSFTLWESNWSKLLDSSIRHFYVNVADESDRLDELHNMLTALKKLCPQRKILIFCFDNEQIKYLLQQGLRDVNYVLDMNNTDVEHRAAIIRQFQQEKNEHFCAMLLSGKDSCYRGLNLLDNNEKGIVINYNCPEYELDYIQQVARCGKNGYAISLVGPENDEVRSRINDSFPMLAIHTDAYFL